jgi:dTDP-4-dehydrorhamnose 3,5-epimerase
MGWPLRRAHPARGGRRLKFTALPVEGAWEIGLEPAIDERGLFGRTWCEREFAGHGIGARFVQSNLSVTRSRGMLRGMHLQARPHQEAKLIRCVRGRVYDVMLDLRPASPTFLRWHAVELDAEGRNAVYIPEGCAQGFVALADDCELHYQMSAFYVPEAKRGVLWNDVAFGIRWPVADPIVSAADQSFPRFDATNWKKAY